MARLLLFDWDGTIFDSQRAKETSWALAALASRGVWDLAWCARLTTPDGIAHITQLLAACAEELARLHQFAGMSRKDTAERVRDVFRLSASASTLGEIRDQIRQPLLDSPLFCRPCSGASEFLALLSEFRPAVKAAVVTQTTSADVRRQIKLFAIPDIFTFLECAGDACYHGVDVPDVKAAAYAAACARAEVPPSDAIAFEDSPSGVLSARHSGIFTIGICASTDDQLPADLCVCPGFGVLDTQPVVTALLSRPPARCRDIICAQVGASAWPVPNSGRALPPRKGRGGRLPRHSSRPSISRSI